MSSRGMITLTKIPEPFINISNKSNSNRSMSIIQPHNLHHNRSTTMDTSAGSTMSKKRKTEHGDESSAARKQPRTEWVDTGLVYCTSIHETPPYVFVDPPDWAKVESTEELFIYHLYVIPELLVQILDNNDFDEYEFLFLSYFMLERFKVHEFDADRAMLPSYSPRKGGVFESTPQGWHAPRLKKDTNLYQYQQENIRWMMGQYSDETPLVQRHLFPTLKLGDREFHFDFKNRLHYTESNPSATYVRRGGCILADEMGLGKTVQVLALCSARDAPPIEAPFAMDESKKTFKINAWLFVVRSGIISQVKDEMKRVNMRARGKVVYVTGKRNFETVTCSDIASASMVVTTHEVRPWFALRNSPMTITVSQALSGSWR